MNKTILITGSSSGIGKATVQYFSSKGWNVAATMRKPENSNELAELKNVKLYRLDVLDENTINTTIENVLKDFGTIDVVVNNAGYATIGAFEAATKEQIEMQFNTNVFGLMNVTRAILPYFRKKNSGRIINISSVGGKLTFPIYSLYHSTKWAVEGFSESLQYELSNKNIKIKIIEPGAIKTDFYDRSQDLLSKEGLHDYDNYINVVLPKTQKFGEKAQGPLIVAKKIYKAATDNRNKLRYPVGGGAGIMLFFRWLLPLNWFRKMIKITLE
ncbi:MAG: SDR family oxidoreductase [Chlorobi bacterium]|nr:SDR family oxidoreductase [Chlorobiota bacterium]